MNVSEVTYPVLERHWSVVQMRRSPSPHELVHKCRVEESEPIVLSTNIETICTRTLVYESISHYLYETINILHVF